MKHLEIYCDGACSGNPGEAAIGIVFQENKKTIRSIGESIGVATNNVAEYKALVRAFEEARNLKADDILIKTDSELLFNQLKGTFAVKNDQLKILLDEIKSLAKTFKRVEFKKIPREENREADRLAKKAISKTGQDGCPEDSFVFGEESPSSKG